MRFQSYFNTAAALISAYDGKVPLTHFLKHYFSQHAKHGSKDRKWITQLCYLYFRLGHAFRNKTIEERLKIALFICLDNPGEWHLLFDPEWLHNWNHAIKERINFLIPDDPEFFWKSIFPFFNQLSQDIAPEKFVYAHFIQPDLFLRIRPGKETIVLNKLAEHTISYHQHENGAIAIPNGTKIETLLTIDKEVVIQDISSQQVGSFFSLIPKALNKTFSVWDCCAASGGKSILAIDKLKNIHLIVSDIRSSILQNLKKRFEVAGITQYESFISDLSLPKAKVINTKPDLIICDAPCSGSGTWSRTPEQLFFFKEDAIIAYANLQRKILQNIIPALKKDGHLLYITCSVFQAENEAIVKIIQENHGLRLIKAELFNGYTKKGDTMFAALFCK